MKRVSFDDEAYRLLRGAKLSPRESFSDVVKRRFGGKREGIERTAGAWAGAGRARLLRLRRERDETFGTTRD